MPGDRIPDNFSPHGKPMMVTTAVEARKLAPIVQLRSVWTARRSRRSAITERTHATRARAAWPNEVAAGVARKWPMSHK